MKRTTLRLVVIVAIMVALLLGLTINSKAASVPFYISNASGEIGQTVAVTIKTTDKIVADDINIDISYDTDKLSITNNDIMLSQAIYDTFTVDENFMYGVKEDQKVISIGGYKMSPFTFEADTNLVTLNFTIKEGTLEDTELSVIIDSENSEDGNRYYGEIKSTITPIFPVTSIEVTPTSGVLNVGETENLTATVLPENATNKTVTWSSSNEAIATVVDGVVTAKGPGEATITATSSNGLTATYTVSVKLPLTGIKLSGSTLAVLLNQSAKLDVIYNEPNTTDDKTVTWTSSDESVATVENGVVKGLKVGTTTITAKVGEFSETCEVTVSELPLEGIALDTKDFLLEEGLKTTLTVLYNPENTTDDRTVIWSSSDEKVATVVDGLVTAVAPGTAKITVATLDGEYTAEVTITVTEKQVVEEEKPTTEEPVTDETTTDEKVETSVEENESDLPNTGDIAIGVFAVLMVISLAGIVFIVKSKRK